MVMSDDIVGEEDRRQWQTSEDKEENVSEPQAKSEQKWDQQKDAGRPGKKGHAEGGSGKQSPTVQFSRAQRRQDGGERPEHRHSVTHRRRGGMNECGTGGKHYCARYRESARQPQFQTDQINQNKTQQPSYWSDQKRAVFPSGYQSAKGHKHWEPYRVHWNHRSRPRP